MFCCGLDRWPQLELFQFVYPFDMCSSHSWRLRILSVRFGWPVNISMFVRSLKWLPDKFRSDHFTKCEISLLESRRGLKCESNATWIDSIGVRMKKLCPKYDRRARRWKTQKIQGSYRSVQIAWTGPQWIETWKSGWVPVRPNLVDRSLKIRKVILRT